MSGKLVIQVEFLSWSSAQPITFFKDQKMRYENKNTGLKKTEKISDQVTLLVYKDRESLCSALCRIEEHYESPEFKGKIFTLGQYREWYSSQFGAWSYYKDWSGFNIPSESFEPFFKGSFDPLSEAEAEVIELFKYKTGKFCVIGTFEGGDSDVYEHEICHALYATNEDYKVEALTAVNKYELKELKSFLADLGYNKSTIPDECHAYICESFQYLKEKNIYFPEELMNELQAIKKHYRSTLKK
jgi:hypothetical protein